MKYTKKQILASSKYEKWRQWLKVNLPDEGTYTLSEVDDYRIPLFEETNDGVKNADGSMTIEVDTDASEVEVLTLGLKGKTGATVRVNDAGSLFYSGHLGLGSLEVNGIMTNGGKAVATQEYVQMNAGGDCKIIISGEQLSNATPNDIIELSISSDNRIFVLPKINAKWEIVFTTMEGCRFPRVSNSSDSVGLVRAPADASFDLPSASSIRVTVYTYASGSSVVFWDGVILSANATFI